MKQPAQEIAKSSAMEARAELVNRIATHVPSVGEHSTAIDGLLVFRRMQATDAIALLLIPASRYS